VALRPSFVFFFFFREPANANSLLSCPHRAHRRGAGSSASALAAARAN